MLVDSMHFGEVRLYMDGMMNRDRIICIKRLSESITFLFFFFFF